MCIDVNAMEDALMANKSLLELARHEATTGNIQKVNYCGEWVNVRQSCGVNVFSAECGYISGATPYKMTVSLRDFIAPDSIRAIRDVICEINTCENLKQLINNET